MANVGAYASLGPRQYLDRFLHEYGISEEQAGNRIQVREPAEPGREREYEVHTSLLRSHGEFPCAGDLTALAFCRGIAEEMVRAYGIPQDEAVARVNRQWSAPGGSGRVPSVWIVGLDLVYHQTVEDWAGDVYYGHDSQWWRRGSRPEPLPPP